MNFSRLAHEGISLAFTICILLVVALPVLIGTGATHQFAKLAGFTKPQTNSLAADAPYTPPTSTRNPIVSGTYAGWTMYHNNTFNFGVDIPAGLQVDEIPETHATAPQYPDFMLQLSTTEAGTPAEYARVTVYDTSLAVNEHAQETSTDPLFAATPTKTTGTLLGHKSMEYFYEGGTRVVVYLIEDGDRTFEIRGLVDTTNPSAVTTYWNTFNNLLKSFSIG